MGLPFIPLKPHNMATIMIRTMDCEFCGITGDHEIRYRGTKLTKQGGKTVIIFDTLCYNCNSHNLNELLQDNYNILVSQTKPTPMSRDNLKIKVLWCSTGCDQPENHRLEYKGTEQGKKGPLAKFQSECLRCTARDDEMKLVDHVVPITDWNALIKVDTLYDIASAP